MKILFISNVYPGPMQKGKGTFNQSMITSIGQRHDVCVVSPIPWTMKLSQWLKTGKKQSYQEEFDLQKIKTEYPTYYYSPKCLDHLYGKMMWGSLKKQH